jgi:hypothetical protein
MADLLALERLCNALPDRIDLAANALAQRVVITMAEDLIEHTPVDVTTAVSNWQASLNTPAGFELPAIFPGHAGSTAAQSRLEALGHVTRVVEEKKPGEVTYLSNLAPHLVYLNDGSSRQEPAGFFERAIVVGESYVQSAQIRI